MDQQKRDVDDELLSALIDDALPPPEQERLRERLEREPALARRFDALRHADAAVRSAYTGVVEQPLPDRVLELLSRPQQLAENEKQNTIVMPLVSRPRALFAKHIFSGPTAIAASVALTVGFLSALAIIPHMREPDAAQLITSAGLVEPGTGLYEVLQSRLSAEAYPLDEHTTVLPRMSFVTKTGDFCRQVEATGPRGTTHAVACRRSGDWRLELARFDESMQPLVDGLYRPAANETPAVLEATVDAIIDGEPLDRKSEQEAIARGWASNSAP